MLDPPLPLLPELLDPPDGGDGLPLPLGLDGPAEGFEGMDGVDVVGHLSVADITEPSGHVLLVGGGVNVCVADAHDGSVGFLVQSTGGGVPVVQRIYPSEN